MAFSPYLEWGITAQWWGLTPKEFRSYSGEEQSEMVAIYRAHSQIEAVVAWVSAKESSAKAS